MQKLSTARPLCKTSRIGQKNGSSDNGRDAVPRANGRTSATSAYSSRDLSSARHRRGAGAALRRYRGHAVHLNEVSSSSPRALTPCQSTGSTPRAELTRRREGSATLRGVPCRAGTLECLPDDLEGVFSLLDFGQHLFSIAALRIFKPRLELGELLFERSAVPFPPAPDCFFLFGCRTF